MSEPADRRNGRSAGLSVSGRDRIAWRVERPKEERLSRNPSSVRRKVRQWSILAVGWVFVLLGIVQLFLPFFQGWIFILIGLVLLSAVSPRARLATRRVRRRWPRTGARIDATRRHANRVLNRMFGG